MLHVTAALCLALTASYAFGMGCLPGICEGNDGNELRACPDSEGTCGHYRGLRFDGRMEEGVDVLCETGRKIRAPFDGVVRAYRPFGSNKDNECLDQGLSVQASADSQWAGYMIKIAYARAIRYNEVKKGDIIGEAIEQNCGAPGYKTDAASHVQVELVKEGRRIDPTSHLRDCLCTGRICESNPTNRIIGQEDGEHPQPVSRPAYNGVFGYPLECALQMDIEDGHGNIIAPSQRAPRAPYIYSPITADFVGRARLNFVEGEHYVGCPNDAIYLKGTGNWKDFTVFIYNARVDNDLKLGAGKIAQGDRIGQRLRCDGTSFDEVFVEIRHGGKFPDMGRQIVSTNCTMPDRFY